MVDYKIWSMDGSSGKRFLIEDDVQMMKKMDGNWVKYADADLGRGADD